MTGVIYALLAFGLLVLLWLGAGILRIGAVSTGRAIGERSGTALLLIDLQEVFWERGPYPEASKMAAKSAILDEIDAAKAQGFPVIAIRQEWSQPATKVIARLAMKGQAVAGTPGTGLAAPFVGSADIVLTKRVQDAFETGTLDVVLQERDVGRLRIVGLDFNYCVFKTALAACNRGYHVTIVERGTLAAAPVLRSRDQLTAQGVIVE
ncbi:cysteine hydrolase [Pseudorhodobacter sp. E13]|uniref:cysteine hydrolase family protein n=1 Tax=Pseudorhodobacter sp. E13 TaxID=2487931 RepID=UPI000F8C6FC3|nr:isochorismatase family cysteine hydrolase [Pseudorhodobacter sp. E13]RUS60777.1 cysteine hydrolase [Pseudorhodobacter sp. E13]